MYLMEALEITGRAQRSNYDRYAVLTREGMAFCNSDGDECKDQDIKSDDLNNDWLSIPLTN